MRASAPLAAQVYDTYYTPSEWVPTAVPVVSLLVPGQVKLRFFVPEPVLGSIAIGQRVRAECSGCPEPIDATVSFVSPRPEYTPPVIYSRESASKLVFLVEAKPEPRQAALLHPGQPVEVRPLPAAPAAAAR
jgi:HlyD family secretion protein